MTTAERVIPVPPEDEFLADVINCPVAQLFVDHRYQRGVKKSSVKNLVENWSWKRYIPIIVVHRREGDRFAVVDGQQRTLAATELGIPWLPAVLIVARNLEDEAERFVGANTGVSVGAGDRFRAEYLRREARYVNIADEVKIAGFQLGCLTEDHSVLVSPYTIDAVHAIEQVYNQGMLVATLTAIAQIWGHAPDRDMVQGAFIQGVYLTLKHLARFGVTQQELVGSVKGMSVREVMDRGYERYKSMVTSRSLPGGIAAVLVERFNYRKRADQTVPPYDRSGARATRGYYAAKTMRENPDFVPFGGKGADGSAWTKTEEGKQRIREQAARIPRSGGRFARRA